jgi:hypothetical protein
VKYDSGPKRDTRPGIDLIIIILREFITVVSMKYDLVNSHLLAQFSHTFIISKFILSGAHPWWSSGFMCLPVLSAVCP